MLRSMKNGAVVVDVAIDQEFLETSHPTTHETIYEVDGSSLLCANMPGAMRDLDDCSD